MPDHYRRKGKGYPDVIPTPDSHPPIRKDLKFRGIGRRPRQYTRFRHPFLTLRKTVPTRTELTPREDVAGVIVRETSGFQGVAKVLSATTAARFLRVTSPRIIQIRSTAPMILHVGLRPAYNLQACKKYEVLLTPQQTVTFENILDQVISRDVEFFASGPTGPGPATILGPWIGAETVHELLPTYGIRRHSGTTGAPELYMDGRNPDYPATVFLNQTVAVPVVDGSFRILPPIASGGLPWQIRLRMELPGPADSTICDDVRFFFPPQRGCKEDQIRLKNAPAEIHIYSDGRESLDTGL